MLYPIGSIKTKKNTPYKVFGPYFKKALQIKIKSPKNVTLKNIHDLLPNQYDNIDEFYIYKKVEIIGGRKQAMNIFRNIENFKFYNSTRNNPNIQTTHLSAHIRFGTVSMRECYYVMSSLKNNLVQQLYWNCFYQELGYYYPDMYRKRYLIPKFKSLKWSKNKQNFFNWMNGTTGFPFSDAGIREMNATGFMHNRVRMISATLCSRILNIDWRWGEKYYSKKLIDHNRPNNEGNWFWVIGTAPHSQPYFRVMNEWSQIKKYDPKCTYIKKWIPELRDINPLHIINWGKYSKLYNVNYPSPMINNS